MEKYLITTAIEESWPSDKYPIIFLGEWCKLYSRKENFSNYDFSVATYHWDDRVKLLKDYQNLKLLYEKILIELKDKLNNIHIVSHDVRYWRIIIGPWLYHFLQVLFDRWCSIKSVEAYHEKLITITLSNLSTLTTPKDIKHFNELFHNDEWNHTIYATIISNYSNIKTINKIQNVKKLKINYYRQSKSKKIIKFKTRIKNITLKIFNFISMKLQYKSILLSNSYLGFYSEFFLQLRMFQIPIFYMESSTFSNELAIQKREWMLDENSGDQFEQFCREMIPIQIPVAYIEGYQDLVKIALGRNIRDPKIIFTSNSHFYDEVFKFSIAELTEKGIPLVIGQHGGHYGIGLWNSSEDHELAIADHYFSWGWTSPSNNIIVPLGRFSQNKQSYLKRRRIKWRISLVTCTLQRYSGSMIASFVGPQYLNYLEDQFDFVRNLSSDIRRTLTVRLFPYDEGWDQLKRWQDEFGDLIFDEGASDIATLMSESRLYVCTYNATTFLESLSLGVPTIIFWNPDQWELRESAIPYFERMESVGVFHKSSISAAIHCVKIWEDVDEWWQSVEVQGAIKEFMFRYNIPLNNRLDAVKKALDSIIDSNTN